MQYLVTMFRGDVPARAAALACSLLVTAVLSTGAAGCQRAADTAATAPSSYIGVDIGAQAVPGVKTANLYPVEHEADGSPFRWTAGDATFQLPPIADAQPRSIKLDVAALVPTTLDVTVGGRTMLHRPLAVGRYSLDADVHAINFRDAQIVHVKSGTWRPSTPSGYTRTLGVEVRGLKLL